MRQTVLISTIFISFLQPAALPILPTAIDLWILRDQEILLTQDWLAEDQVINMNFSGFETQVKTVFSQSLKPTVQPFNQGLVIIDKRLQFLTMESSLVFEVDATSDLKRVHTKLYQNFLIN